MKLEVGKEYNMNNIKEVKVTNDFLSLDRATISCQKDESIDDCKTRDYIDKLVKECNCFPYSIMDLTKVILWVSFKKFDNFIYRTFA